MKFDFVIGNPPYQDETIGDNKGFAPPVYHKFLENAYKIGDVVEMIHPARFLFNAGSGFYLKIFGPGCDNPPI